MRNIIRNNYLFEISWEVCNKVGGIYTVLNSKARFSDSNFKNHYFLGPYLNKETYEKTNEFIEKKVPKKFEKETKILRGIGIVLHFGVWNNSVKSKVILIEYLGFSKHINNIKTFLWDRFQVDSLNSNWYDFDEAILWSWCCGVVIENLTKNLNLKNSKVLVHSHEWMSGGAIFYINSLEKNISDKFKTIFTTHATMLGRSISQNGESLYQNLENYNPNEKSYQLGMYTKQQTEKALANIANCFTTVSDITNIEAKKFYDKNVDILLPNGFDVKSQTKTQILKEFSLSRNTFLDFLRGYCYDFNRELDFKNSEILYTSGRNEFLDKGVDIFIKSLSILNKKLKKENSGKTVFACFMIPIGNFELNSEVISSIKNFKKSLRNKSFKKMQIKTLDIKQLPISTNLVPEDLEIIKSLKDNSLNNLSEDRVKVILIPNYLSKNDGVFNLDYYEVIKGTSLGVFPSRYEPWGYTPLESIAYSVPTISSNLAGFGIWNEENYKGFSGVEVLDIKNKSFEEVTEDLAEFFEKFLDLDEKTVKNLKISSYKLSRKYSWEKFYNNYLNAYKIAIKK